MTSNGDKSSITPWKNGFYQSTVMPTTIFFIENETFCFFPASGKPTNLKDNPSLNGTIKFGDFGEIHPDVAKASGKNQANTEIIAFGGKFKAPCVLNDEGTKLTYYGPQAAVDAIEWKSEEEIAKYRECGDPVEACPHPYKIQPENQGKLLWLSGAPGLGKSTSGLLISKKAGYVYFEADCFLNHLNPYVPTDVAEPTLAQMSQNFLSGVPQERIDIVADGYHNFMAMGNGLEYNFEELAKFYSAMAENVVSEQERIGGDFVVAQAVPTRALRDHLRTKLGSNLIFVVLHMSREDQMERVQGRHGDEKSFTEMLTKMYELYEPAADDEPNTIGIMLTKDMSKDKVADEILRLVNK